MKEFFSSKVGKVVLVLLILLLAVAGYGGFRFYSISPKSVLVTNLTDRSATVTWETRGETPGVAIADAEGFVLGMRVGRFGDVMIADDDRDLRKAELAAAEANRNNEGETVAASDIETVEKIDERGKYYTHHVTFTNLEPETEYEFMVGDGLFFLRADSYATETPTFTTYMERAEIDAPYPMYGKIYEREFTDEAETSKPSDDAVLYLMIRNEDGTSSQIYSSPTTEIGAWYIDLSTIKSYSGGSWDIKAEGNYEFLWAIGGEKGDVLPYRNSTYLNSPMHNLYFDSLKISDYQIMQGEQLPAESSLLKVISTEVRDLFVSDVDAKSRDRNEKTESKDANAAKIIDTPPPVIPAPPKKDSPIKPVVEEPSKTTENPVEVEPQTPGVEEAPSVEETPIAQTNYTKDNCPSNLNMHWCYRISECVSGDKMVFAGGCNGCDSYVAITAKGTHECVGGNLVKKTDLPVNQVVTDETAASTTLIANPQLLNCDAADCNNPGVTPETPPTDPNEEVLGCKVKDGSILPNGQVKEYVDEGNLTKSYSPNSIIDSCRLYSTTLICESGSNSDDGNMVFVANSCLDYDQDETEVAATAVVSGEAPKVCDNQNLDCSLKISGVTPVEGAEECNNRNGNTFYCCPADTEIINGKCQSPLPENYPDCDEGLSCPGNVTGSFVCLNRATNALKHCCPIGTIEFDKKCITPGQEESTNKQNIFTPAVVLAQSEENSADTIIFDPQQGLYTFEEAGEYKLTYQGEEYKVIVSEDLVNKAITVFIDTNGDGIKNGEEMALFENPFTLNLSKEASAVTYDFKQGINFVSFPMIMGEYNTAKAFLNHVNNEQNDALFSIAQFESTFKVVGANGGDFDTYDFQIIPGKGYVVKAKRDFTISLSGKEVVYESEADSAPIYFGPGWNLIGIYGTNTKSYTAESLIDGVNAYETTPLTVDNVTRWPEDLGRYQGLQKEKDESGVDQVYGFDFPIESYKAYFVRVTEGSGTWEPEIQE